MICTSLTVSASGISAEGLAVTAESCGSCHGRGGISLGEIPGLAGQDADSLMQALRDFRDGRRDGTIMARLVAPLTDQEISDIAAYFAAQSVVRP